MLGDLWRTIVAIADWRAFARLIAGQPEMDVVFITNLRDEAERKRFFGRRVPPLGHANGPRVYARGIAGRVRGLYVTAAEMLTKDGRRLARNQFIGACEWAERKGAKTVLLAAGTKRLFGRDGESLKALFPNLMFTIGDNGTTQLLWRDIERALNRAGLAPGRARILVICPYGILGSEMTGQLVRAGYDVIGIGANRTALEAEGRRWNVPVTTEITEVGEVDAVIACTHHAASKLGVSSVEHLRRTGRKLLVLDVSEPANLDQEVYAACQDHVVRQDAGNGFSRRLTYVLGALSWNKLMLSRGTVFGCFAEAMALTYAVQRLGRRDLADRDWFEVSAENRALVDDVLPHLGFEPPAPRCFGARVRDFSLELDTCATDGSRPGPRFVASAA